MLAIGKPGSDLADERLQLFLAFHQWLLLDVPAIQRQQIESDKMQWFADFAGKNLLQKGKTRMAVIIKDDDFAVNQRLGVQAAENIDKPAEPGGPILA